LVTNSVSITTPLTTAVRAFLVRMQAKGVAAASVDDPRAFRQAVRVEARQQHLRVRTGIARQDPQVVWACDLDHRLSDEEYERASNHAVKLLDSLGAK
jgi:hypothetical protein